MRIDTYTALKREYGLQQFTVAAYRHYGLKGKVVLVKWNSCPDMVWKGIWLPVKIIEEYPKFLYGIVLKHNNPDGYGESKEYPITISKIGILKNEFQIRGFHANIQKQAKSA